MASIQTRTHKNGSTTHRVLWRQDGKQRNLSFVDLDSADRFRINVETHGPDEALAVLGLLDRDRAGDQTLKQWLTEHVDGLTGIQDGTRSRYKSYIDNDLGELSDLPLQAVTEAAIGRWVAAMDKKKASGKTIQNKHAFLSGALRAAVRAGKIDRNPCENRRLPRTMKKEMVFLSRDEFNSIHGAITNPMLADLALWLVSTGMRFGEATALQPSDIDLTAKTCRITRAWKHTGAYGRELGPPKSRRSVRTIDLPSQAVDIAQRRGDGEWLFSNGVGNPIAPQDFYNRAWGEARKKALPKRPRVHDLRHTCASWMIAAGIPIVVVSRHLGHEDIATTVNTYSHVDRTSGRAAADAIGEMLSDA